MLGEKRRGPDSQDQKRSTTNNEPDMIEVIINILNKNRNMTFDALSKELKRYEFSPYDIELRLQPLLSRLCKRFNQNGEINYYLKGN